MLAGSEKAGAFPTATPARGGVEMDESGAEGDEVREVSQVFGDDDPAAGLQVAPGLREPAAAVVLTAEFVDGQQAENDVGTLVC